MTRVLHVISGLGRGGAESVLFGLLSAQDKSLISSRVVSLTDEGYFGPCLREAGIAVDVVRMPGGFPRWGMGAELRRLVEAFQPDVICGWMYRGNWGASLARRYARDARLVWNIRHSLHFWTQEGWKFRFTVFVNRLLSRCPDLIVYNSETCRIQHRQFGFSSQADTVILNGFDLQRFQPQPDQRRLVRDEWGVPRHACVVGLIARWHPIKNHIGFLEAAAAALQRHPETVFVLAGQDVDPSNHELVALVTKFQLENSVRLLGPVDRIERVLVALDLLVSASWGEAFPNVVGEALACGVACLATDVGESKALVGNSGRVVRPEELGEAMSSMLDSRVEGLASLGSEGARMMRDQFHHQKMVDRYTQLLLSQGER